MRRRSVCLHLAATLLSAGLLASQPNVADLHALLDRIGDRVEQYYNRARSVVCEETVRLQPLAMDLAPDGFARRLVYELRVDWDAADGDGDVSHDASVVRHILSVDGRPPKAKDEPGCMDPKPVSPEPLAFLRPGHRDDYAFTLAGPGRVDRMNAVMIDYKAANKKPPEIVWHNDCVSVDLPSQVRGRIWVDAASDDVLRIDEHLTGMFEIPVPREHVRHGAAATMVIERADSSIRYRPVVFHDPEETLLLPASIETVTVIRNAGVPRLRTVQEFTKYRRFMTGGRLVR